MDRRSRGFSLTEILVTVTFAPLFGALLFSFVQSSFRATRLQQASSEAQDTAHLALSFVGRDFRQAGFTPDFTALTALARAESGSAAVRSDLNGDGDSDDAGESIAYQEDASRHTLTRASGGSPPQPLADHLATGSLRFAYYDGTGARLDPGGGGLDLERRRRVRRIDVSFTIAVSDVVSVLASGTVELRNVH